MMIYLDHAATTRIDPELWQKYQKANYDLFANPASSHGLGLKNEIFLKEANVRILEALHLNPPDYRVIHLSGATSANNLAIVGYALRNQNKGKHLICLCSEHPSVLESYHYLEKEHGFAVTYLPLDKNGQADLAKFQSALTERTILVSIGLVNSEVGFVNDLAQVQALMKDHSAVLHVDLVQGLGAVPLPDLRGVGLMCISLHKLGGVKNHGLLIKQANLMLKPLSYGGNQQDVHSGTVDLPGAIMLASAIKKAQENECINRPNIRDLNNYLSEQLAKIPGIVLNSNSYCSPYIVNFSLLKHQASVVVEELSRKEIYVTSGSACASRTDAPSPTLLCLNKPIFLARNSIRVSMAKSTTKAELDAFLTALTQILKEVRAYE